MTKVARVARGGLFIEAFTSVAVRPWRVVLTGVGTILGLAVLVAIQSLTSSADLQVDRRFRDAQSTEIRVTPVTEGAIPSGADGAVARISGVSASGLIWTVRQDGILASTRRPDLSSARQQKHVQVVAVSVGFLSESSVSLSSGAKWTAFEEKSNARVAIVGIGLARQLGLSDSASRGEGVVFIEGVPFHVSGVISDAQRHAEILGQLLVPMSTAHVLWPGEGEDSEVLYVSTTPGATDLVSEQVALALRPDRPDLLRVASPARPDKLQGLIAGDLKALFSVLGVVCLGIGVLSITTATLMSVLERIPEIGLRRALGALKWHIVAQLLIESVMIGFVAGMIGTSIGAIVAVSVATHNEWPPVVSLWIVAIGPVAGAAAGLVAGLYPAWRAARMEPTIALRA
jgi:putative ABC transport system permease protein